MHRCEPMTRIERLFEEASERPPSEREAFLKGACGPDTALRMEVESLLRAQKQAGDFMNRPALGQRVEPAPIAEGLAPGRIVGAYKLQASIGEGGMSRVYLATRSDDLFRRRVAIKLLPLSRASAENWHRFQTERHILASLDHPYIARLYDAGTTEEGLPYFVMEHVEGEPIDDYCDRHRLTIRERLELFCKACCAVGYAHQNLVVHCDVKPTNILVNQEGAPKLIDFGIARLLNPELTSASLQTGLTWHRVLTPDYASPEQIQGKTITRASDVYSLGILLYKLLAGRTPFRLEGRPPQEVERILMEEAPERPSLAFALMSPVSNRVESDLTPGSLSRVRNDAPQLLRRQLSGDLDKIVLKAVVQAPQRRYDSAQRLSEDIGRFLAGLPVDARQATWSYRAGKLLRRRRSAVAASAGLFIFTASMIILMALQSTQIARELDQLQRQRQTMARQINSLSLVLQDLGKPRTAESMIRQAIDMNRNLLGDKHPETALSMGQLGFLLHDRGDFEGAEPLLQQALDIQRQTMGQEHPSTLSTLNRLIRLYEAWGKPDMATRYRSMLPEHEAAKTRPGAARE